MSDTQNTLHTMIMTCLITYKTNTQFTYYAMKKLKLWWIIPYHCGPIAHCHYIYIYYELSSCQVSVHFFYLPNTQYMASNCCLSCWMCETAYTDIPSDLGCSALLEQEKGDISGPGSNLHVRLAYCWHIVCAHAISWNFSKIRRWCCLRDSAQMMWCWCCWELLLNCWLYKNIDGEVIDAGIVVTDTSCPPFVVNADVASGIPDADQLIVLLMQSVVLIMLLMIMFLMLF